MRSRWFSILLFLLAQTVCAEELSLQVFSLKHRTSEEILPVLQPLVSAGGTVTGMNDQIIVRTTPENLIQIKEVLTRIDKRPQRLRIAVRQASNAVDTGLDQGVSGTYRSDGTSRGDFRVYGTEGYADDSQTHFLQVIEGRPAFIQTGKSVPLPGHVVTFPGSGVLEGSIEYHDVVSGFDVIPTLNGDNVTLAISPRHSQMDPSGGGVIDRQTAETMVTGKLGEWLELGGATQNIDQDAHANLYQTRRYGSQQYHIWVKVDRAP